MTSRLKATLTIALALGLIVLAAAVAAHKWPMPSNDRQGKNDEVSDALPPVISSIKGIEVVATFIDAQRQANVIVVNKTGKTIVGLSLSSGNLTFSDDNGISQDNPKPLIEPNASYTFQQPITNLRAHQTIRISAAFYADGSEDGDTIVRKSVHEERERQRDKRSREGKNN